MPIRTAIDVSVYQQQSRVAQVKSVAKLVMPAQLDLHLEDQIETEHLRAQWKHEMNS